MAEGIRVQKAIAHAGLMSRRAAEEAISQGRIAVDGETVTLGDRVDVSSQVVTLDGSPIPVKPDLRTYLLYKPVGVVSTASDPRGRTTVVDLVAAPTRVYPVGRLDSDSEGLILVSNDGVLTERVTHPRYGITKKYLAELDGVPKAGELRRLEEGIDLDDGPARAVRARLVGTSGGSSQVEIVMAEGRNREVRRLFEAVGYDTMRLVRTAIGSITDPTLKPGEARLLDNREVAALMRSARG